MENSIVKHGAVLLIISAVLAGCDNRMQKVEIEQIAHNYIANNPEVIVESVMRLQKEVADRKQEKVLTLLNRYRENIDNTTGVPKIGADDSDISILMFGNYTDTKAKAMMRIFDRHMDQDSKIRVLVRMLPGKSLVGQKAARVGLALLKQNLFLSFHKKIIHFEGELNDLALTQILQTIKGLDFEKLNKDMNSLDVANALERDQALAKNLGILESPGYIIKDYLLKQPLSFDDIGFVIQDVRRQKKAVH